MLVANGCAGKMVPRMVIELSPSPCWEIQEDAEHGGEMSSSGISVRIALKAIPEAKSRMSPPAMRRISGLNGTSVILRYLCTRGSGGAGVPGQRVIVSNFAAEVREFEQEMLLAYPLEVHDRPRVLPAAGERDDLPRPNDSCATRVPT